MSINKMQHKVKEFVDSYNLQTDLATRLLDLVSEVGELSKEVLKATSYGKKDIELTENFSSELGDVFFALLCIANSTNTNLQSCLNEVLLKYQQRFSNKGSIDSGN